MFTINQQFATTLFRYLPEINWFTATNFRDKALSSSVFFYYLNCVANTGPLREIFTTVIYLNVQLLR